MTSPAIELARKCGLPSADIEALQEHQPEFLETFYARAQAQALENTANEFDNHREADGRSIQFANALRRMAEELEHKA